MPIRHESQLYVPVRQFFESRGYRVRGEVEGCDLAATRGDELAIVELKRAFHLSLIYQGMDRQRLTDQVYLAVESPKRRRHWAAAQRLCRQLGLGLISVTFRQRGAEVFSEVEPRGDAQRRRGRRRDRVLRELAERSADFNVGGATRQPLVTAYREESLRVAHHLRANGPSRVAKLRTAAPSPRAGSILLKNYYGWFERVSRGVYGLTPQGEQGLAQFERVLRGLGLERPTTVSPSAPCPRAGL